ncbi:hypothetical protein ACHAQI_000168 [Fusarium lateritium]
MSQRSSKTAIEKAPTIERPLPNIRADNVLSAIEEVEAADKRNKQPKRAGKRRSRADSHGASMEEAMDGLWRSMQALSASPTSNPRTHIRVPASPAMFRVVKQIDDAIERNLAPEECGHIKDTMDAKYYEELMADQSAQSLQWVDNVPRDSSAQAEPDSNTETMDHGWDDYLDHDFDDVKYEDSDEEVDDRKKHLGVRGKEHHQSLNVDDLIAGFAGPDDAEDQEEDMQDEDGDIFEP